MNNRAAKIPKARPACKFRTRLRSDGRHAIELYPPDAPGKIFGFLMWIESADGKLCTCSHPDFAVQSFFALEEAEGLCEWLNDAYEKEKIG